MPVFLALILGVKWNINLEYGLSLLGSGEVINVRISQADLALLRQLTLLCLFFKAHQSQAQLLLLALPSFSNSWCLRNP